MIREIPERRGEMGFTLIELLVVILVLGILAAIALPVFLGQQTKGQDADAKSNARNLVSQVDSCYAETNAYTSCDSAAELGPTGLDVDTAGDVPSDGKVAVSESAGSTFTVVAKSKSDLYYAITKDSTGVVSRRCGTVMSASGVAAGNTGGGCRSGHAW